jgi:signal transduction histidine kinase
MRHDPSPVDSNDGLRRRAEAGLGSLSADAVPPDSARLLHELSVHQIELELQNEELMSRRAEVEAGLALYTDLYDFAPVAYASLGPDGTIAQANLACARLLGMERSLLQVMRLGQFVVDGDRRFFNDWLKRVFDSSTAQRCQVLLSVAGFAGAAGDRGRTVQIDAERAPDSPLCRAVLLDVTERLQAEASLRSLEVQLRESQKMEAIGTLAGGIAHDFNNILGGILGNLDLARQDVGAGHPALQALEQIHKASLRARLLVQQILVFSHRQSEPAGQQAVRAPVVETLALLRTTLPAGVRMQVDLADAPLFVLADATELHQVVMNLCTNAWQALKDGVGCISVVLDSTLIGDGVAPRAGHLPPGRYAHLRVSDDGTGMDAAVQAHVFEPFFTTKPAGQGTGLGLAVVHGIVATHGGAITLDSAPGRGSTFDVYLPLLDAPVDNVPVSPVTPKGSVAGHGQHVLYVDDDEVMLVMVQRLLQRLGYRVSGFADPQAALTTVREQPRAFDLVVTDFNMPGMSGLQLAAALAALRPDLPIILSSGYVTEDIRTHAMRLGVRDVLHKENTLEELGKLVARVLTRN